MNHSALLPRVKRRALQIDSQSGVTDTTAEASQRESATDAAQSLMSFIAVIAATEATSFTKIGEIIDKALLQTTLLPDGLTKTVLFPCQAADQCPRELTNVLLAFHLLGAGVLGRRLRVPVW